MILSQLKTWWPEERCRRCAAWRGHGAAPDCGRAASGAKCLHGRRRWAGRKMRWSQRCEGGPAGTRSSSSRWKSGGCARRPTCEEQAARGLSAAIEDRQRSVRSPQEPADCTQAAAVSNTEVRAGAHRLCSLEKQRPIPLHGHQCSLHPGMNAERVQPTELMRQGMRVMW